jgi:hypothetical protein
MVGGVFDPGFAVRATLVNPRYTGYRIWNKQRKDADEADAAD